MSKKTADKKAAIAVIDTIEDGLKSKKCSKCGNMAKAVEMTEAAFSVSQDPEVVKLAGKVRDLRAGLQKSAFDDLGCGGCSGDRIKKKLTSAFEVPKPVGKKLAKGPALIEAGEPKPLRADKWGRYEVQVQQKPPLLRCALFDKKGRPVAIITGLSADAIVAKAVKVGLIDRLECAARLGAELARAEATLCP
jgi:hypothetical protein